MRETKLLNNVGQTPVKFRFDKLIQTFRWLIGVFCLLLFICSPMLLVFMVVVFMVHITVVNFNNQCAW